MMQDIVGNYEIPGTVPEWAWVEREASFAHVRNGQDGIWEFVLNLSSSWNHIPAKMLPVIRDARAKNMAYIIFNQGT